MKKAVMLVALFFVFGCATVLPPSPVEIVGPLVEPEIEAAIDAEHELEIKTLKDIENFWEGEQIPLTIYLSMQVGAEVTMEKMSVDLFDDNLIAIITTRIFLEYGPESIGRIYVIITAPKGEWQVTDMVVRFSDEFIAVIEGRNEQQF